MDMPQGKQLETHYLEVPKFIKRASRMRGFFIGNLPALSYFHALLNPNLNRAIGNFEKSIKGSLC
jgi:hypothetical protein